MISRKSKLGISFCSCNVLVGPQDVKLYSLWVRGIRLTDSMLRETQAEFISLLESSWFLWKKEIVHHGLSIIWNAEINSTCHIPSYTSPLMASMAETR